MTLRVTMTASVATKLSALLVDRTFKDHYEKLDSGCSVRPCYHETSRSLDVARLVESGLVIGKRRAHLDVEDNPELVQALSNRIEQFVSAGFFARRSTGALRRVMYELSRWSERSPLERLAEAGIVRRRYRQER
jgi:hypothetical protein